MFTRKKTADEIKITLRIKLNHIWSISNKCDLCDADYVGFTRLHLNAWTNINIRRLANTYATYTTHRIKIYVTNTILKNSKCRGKLDCLIYEILFIKEKKLS